MAFSQARAIHVKSEPEALFTQMLGGNATCAVSALPRELACGAPGSVLRRLAVGGVGVLLRPPPSPLSSPVGSVGGNGGALLLRSPSGGRTGAGTGGSKGTDAGIGRSKGAGAGTGRSKGSGAGTGRSKGVGAGTGRSKGAGTGSTQADAGPAPSPSSAVGTPCQSTTSSIRPGRSWRSYRARSSAGRALVVKNAML